MTLGLMKFWIRNKKYYILMNIFKFDQYQWKCQIANWILFILFSQIQLFWKTNNLCALGVGFIS